MANEEIDLLEMILKDEAEEDSVEQYMSILTQYINISQLQIIPNNISNRVLLNGRAANFNRNFKFGHDRIYQDYFASNPVYPASIFRRRFRMRRKLFLKIHDAVVEYDSYFFHKTDALGNLGLSSLQKVIAALRIFAYGIAYDGVDEYIRIAESTATKCFKQFATAIVDLYSNEYLRHPTIEDIQYHLLINEKRGFPGMFGSLDCTHWEWKNCPVAWQGQFQDRKGSRSLVMEAIATQDLWIWHAFIGLPGSNNDINIMDRSPLLTNLLKGIASNVQFTINENQYDMCYLLCDGIYPDWSIFIKPISEPQGRKRQFYTKKQESLRKDVERCFGILQSRFAIIKNPGRFWDLNEMRTIWKAAIIMHNMIIQDEKPFLDLNQDYLMEENNIIVQYYPQIPLTFDRLMYSMIDIRNKEHHFKLRDDLIEYLWKKHGEEE